MKKGILLLLVCLLVSSSMCIAQDVTSLGDIQKIVREEVKKSTDEVTKHQDEVITSVQENTASFANRVMGDFIKVVNDAEKKIILIASISIAGILLLIEGLFGFIRIRKEAGLLMLMKRDIDNMKQAVSMLTNDSQLMKRESMQVRDILKELILELKQERIVVDKDGLTSQYATDKVSKELLSNERLKESKYSFEQKVDVNDMVVSKINELKERLETLEESSTTALNVPVYSDKKQQRNQQKAEKMLDKLKQEEIKIRQKYGIQSNTSKDSILENRTIVN